MHEKLNELINEIASLPLDEKVEAINRVKISLHEISPFASEPVDLVLWVKSASVHANDSFEPKQIKMIEDLIFNRII